MLLRLLEENRPVDMILFCDTGLEFPALYDHIRKVEQNTGRDITVAKCKEDFEYLFANKKVKRDSKSLYATKYGVAGNGYGWAGPKNRWCTGELKNKPREECLRELKKKYAVIEYIGIAADETERITRKCNSRPNVRLPLVEWGMTEADCLQYCKERGYDWGGLYEKFGRVSCWCCPLQSLSGLRVLYSDFPELWAQFKRWDAMTWRPFKPNYTVLQLEIRFAFEKECLAKGLSIKNKAFFTALRQKLGEISS